MKSIKYIFTGYLLILGPFCCQTMVAELDESSKCPVFVSNDIYAPSFYNDTDQSLVISIEAKKGQGQILELAPREAKCDVDIETTITKITAKGGIVLWPLAGTNLKPGECCTVWVFYLDGKTLKVKTVPKQIYSKDMKEYFNRMNNKN